MRGLEHVRKKPGSVAGWEVTCKGRNVVERNRFQLRAERLSAMTGM